MNDDRRRGRQLVVGPANDHETGPITVLVPWRCAAIETRLQYDAMRSETGRKKKKKKETKETSYSCVSSTLCLSAFTGENTQENRLQRAFLGRVWTGPDKRSLETLR